MALSFCTDLCVFRGPILAGTTASNNIHRIEGEKGIDDSSVDPFLTRGQLKIGSQPSARRHTLQDQDRDENLPVFIAGTVYPVCI